MRRCDRAGFFSLCAILFLASCSSPTGGSSAASNGSNGANNTGGGTKNGGGGTAPNYAVLMSGGYNGTSPIDNAELYDISGDSIAPAASMIGRRTEFSLTRLPDGTVLAAGGVDIPSYGVVVSGTAEIFSPTTGRFVGTTNMHCSHSYHTATMLNNGEVLIAGGSNPACAEVYNPITKAWTVVGPMTTVRYEATATLLQSGKVLIAGGGASAGSILESSANTAELFDPSTDTFTATGNMQSPRGGHTATLLSSGDVLVAGGYCCFSVGSQVGGASTTFFATAELYNATTGTFSQTGSMSVARVNATATPMQNGSVLIAGGYTPATTTSTAEIYNPTAGGFAITGNMSVARSNASAVLLSDGSVLVIGGNSSSTNCDLYNPNTSQFSTCGKLGAATVGGSAAALQAPE